MALLGPGALHAQSAQGQTAPARTQAAPNAPVAAGPNEIEAVDRILALLKNDQSRAAFVANLEQLRQTLAAQGTPAGAPGGARPAAQRTAPNAPVGEAAGANAGQPVDTAGNGSANGAASESGAAPNAGLLGALSTGIASVGQDLPSKVLGGPIDEKLDDASQQVQTRLILGLQTGDLENFLMWAVPAWGLAFAVWFITRAIVLRRAGAWGTKPPPKQKLAVHVAIVTVWRLLPVVLASAVLFLWSLLFPGTDLRTSILFALAVPPLWGALFGHIVNAGLMALGPTRGWRIVAYAQRRVTPYIALLGGAAAASGILKDPSTRLALGFDAAQIASLVLDIAIGLFALWIIATRRLAVQHLIAGRRGRVEDETNEPFAKRLQSRFAARWHVAGYVFIIGNLLARAIGLGGGWSIVTAMAAMFVMLVVLAVALMVDRHLAGIETRMRRANRGNTPLIRLRLLTLLRAYARVGFFLAVLYGFMRLWGLRAEDWLTSGLGWSIAMPILSILAAFTAGWVLWVVLDSLIMQALAPVDRRGHVRAHSNRVRTLLPFLRNVLFIVLCVLTVIAVLANLGINVAPLLAGAGVVGLAVGFGSQQLVQDLITGLFILFEDTIAVGDVIDTGDRAGVVEGMTIRTVRVRDGDGALHSIPFSQIKALKNRSRDYGVYTVKVAIGYDADLSRVMDVMREIGAELQKDAKFAYNILAPIDIWGVDQFAAEGVVVMGAIRTRPLQQWGVGREFNLRLKRRLDELGIIMQAPRMVLLDRHGQTPALPEPPQGAIGDHLRAS